jgi:diguanylate cyclase (GGDEF)-like protein
VLLARRFAATLDRELAAIESGVRVLASAPALDGGDLAAFHALALGTVRGQRGAHYLLTDRDGRQLANTLRPYGTPLPTGGLPAELDAVFARRSAAVTDVFAGPLTGTPLVLVRVPVFHGDEVAYSLGIALAPERLDAVLASHPMPEGWVASVLDSSGTIVTRTRDAQRFVGQKAVPAVVQQIAQGQEGTIETQTMEGAPSVSSFSRSAVSGWSVAVGAPKATIEAGLVRLVAKVGAGVAIGLGIGLWLARRLAVGVASAVRDLNDAAIALVEGRPVAMPASRLREAEAVGTALQRAGDLLAHHDVLTGLHNRALFEQELRRQLAASQRSGHSLAVLAIDLDGFKAVNDRHTHAAGDLVLKAAAARIQAGVRAYDVAARLGGDEFVVLLPDIEPEAVQRMAERLVDALSLPYGEGLAPVSASVGVAAACASAATAEGLLAQADRALYAAKRAGKRRALMHA